MNYQDWAPELNFIIKFLKEKEIEKAREKLENCLYEIRHMDTQAKRGKVDEINRSIFRLQKEIENIEILLNKMKLKHSMDFSDFEDMLYDFKEELIQLKKTKRNTSNRS